MLKCFRAVLLYTILQSRDTCLIPFHSLLYTAFFQALGSPTKLEKTSTERKVIDQSFLAVCLVGGGVRGKELSPLPTHGASVEAATVQEGCLVGAEGAQRELAMVPICCVISWKCMLLCFACGMSSGPVLARSASPRAGLLAKTWRRDKRHWAKNKHVADRYSHGHICEP